ncbi:hypothetical protein Slin14017_G071790 [Septoria linicola]|nr:hypothetical protein Slin14017_G071790 [Septoria linicola]
MSPPSANVFALLATDADSEPVANSPPSPPSSPTSTDTFTTAPSSPTTPSAPSTPSSSDVSSFTPIISKRSLKKAAAASTRRHGGPDAGPVGKGSSAPTIMGRKVASSWLDCHGQWHFVYEDELIKNHDREPGRRVLRGKGKGVIKNRK